jgi:uncharacterized membrane protein
MSSEVFAGLGQQSPLSGMMGNYAWAPLVELFLLILIAVAVIAELLSIPSKPKRGTMKEGKMGETRKGGEILISPYCKATKSPSARFCGNCRASLEH